MLLVTSSSSPLAFLVSLSAKLTLLYADLFTLSVACIGICQCGDHLGFITVFGGFLAYAAIVWLGMCIACEENLDTIIWNGPNENLSLAPYAADIIRILFSSALDLTIRIPEAAAVTSTLC